MIRRACRPVGVTWASTLAAIAAFTLGSSVFAQDVGARYPNRLPDWLWDTPAHAHLLSAEEVLGLRRDIARLSDLRKHDPRAWEALDEDIANRLSSRFAVRDLSAGAHISSSASSGLSLAVQFDPAFSAEARTVLEQAVARFLDVALDPAVIFQAFERSSRTPEPMPEKFQIDNDRPREDEAQRQVPTGAYALYLSQRPRPDSPAQFARHLRNALETASGDAPALVISSYAGNVWWGGGKYGQFHAPEQQLRRELPAAGYLYIRLNTDKLRPPEPHWDDPVFWASKIGHEMLHNLGYWHPDYRDPAHRDESNVDKGWAFIVAYEAAVLERLRKQ